LWILKVWGKGSIPFTRSNLHIPQQNKGFRGFFFPQKSKMNNKRITHATSVLMQAVAFLVALEAVFIPSL